MIAQLEESIARFKEAKFLKVNNRVNKNYRDFKMVKWLQPGSLVVVYRPAGKAGRDPVSV